MTTRRAILQSGVAALLVYRRSLAVDSGLFDVRKFGATGDGKALDTAAINKAIEAAAAAGGGTVHFPAGNYLSYSIRLKSDITLYLDQGATIIGAESSPTAGYDSPEPSDSTRRRTERRQ